MISFTIKPGVDMNGIRPEMTDVKLVAMCAFGKHGAIVTSATDRPHGRGSLHYAGLALDFRTRHLPARKAGKIVAAMKTALSRQYDVVLEKDHIHVEFQPKE